MRKIKVYMCGVDYQHELGECNDIIAYASVEVLKEKRTCWTECGIVELEVTLSKWVEPQELYKKKEDELYVGPY